MKILHGKQLVDELRELSDSVSKRLWIAVPYIGNPKSVGQILGREWFDNLSVDVRLLTDVADLSCLNTETIQCFHNRGQVKTLRGLHAKIYIVDDACLVTSANLTNTAFSKRYEIGILYKSHQSKQIINIFDDWWYKSEKVDTYQLNKIPSTKNSSNEEAGISLPKLFDLPSYPGAFVNTLKTKSFLKYPKLVDDYKDFSKKYESIQRIWIKQPLYLEVDAFLNYLYKSEERPSKEYETKTSRKLTDKAQKRKIEIWAFKFKESVKKNKEDNQRRLDTSEFIGKELAQGRIKTLKPKDIKNLLLMTNAGNSRRGNCNKIVDTNDISDHYCPIKIGINKNTRF